MRSRAAVQALTGLIEAGRDYVAALTGIKQQFVDLGWSPESAEELVVEMVRGANDDSGDD